MQVESVRFPATPIALKMAVAIGIGMLAGMERELLEQKMCGDPDFCHRCSAWDGGLRDRAERRHRITGWRFPFDCVDECPEHSDRPFRRDHYFGSPDFELSCSAYWSVLATSSHPWRGAIVMTMLLAWKTELSRFAGGLQPSEIRSAVLLGLIGFVIYPVLPNRYIDPWQLFNPKDAWITVIAIAGIGFVNYVLLRVYSTRGLYLGALFGGLVNSSATVAELAARAQATGMVARTTALCLLTTIAMFARNLIIATLFSPGSLSATLVPLLAMTLVAGVRVWRDRMIDDEVTGTLTLTSPVSLGKVLWFGTLFIAIQIAGTLLTRSFGSYGMLERDVFGGGSSASTTAAAATMAMHGRISPALAGSATVLTSLASAAVNLPILWRTTKNKGVVKRASLQMASVIGIGVFAVAIDRVFQLSELLGRH